MFKYGLGLFLNNLKNSERLGVSKESEMEVGVKPVTYGCSRSQVKKMYPEGRNYCHPSVSMEDPHGYQNLRML